MGVDIRTPVDQGLLVVRKLRQEVPHKSFQTDRIIPRQKHRIGEPALVEIPGALHGLRVGARVRQRDLVAAVVFEGDGGVGAEDGLSEVVGLGVCEEDVVPAPVALVQVGDCEVGEVLRGERVEAAEDDGFVDGEPVAVGMGVS